MYWSQGPLHGEGLGNGECRDIPFRDDRKAWAAIWLGIEEFIFSSVTMHNTAFMQRSRMIPGYYTSLGLP